MKLIQDIIDVLTSKNPNLTTALMKTKVLLFKLGEKDLAQWVNHELNGYPSKDGVPKYRITPTRIIGTVECGNRMISNMEIPIYNKIPEDLQKFLRSVHSTESIAGLETLLYQKDPASTIISRIPISTRQLLNKGLSPSCTLHEAGLEISKNDLAGILTKVQSKLLDFVLELEDKIPKDIKESNLKEISKDINAKGIFQNAVFGDNTNIIIGNENTQKTENIVKKGDFSSLKEYLKENNVSKKDIAALENSLNKDKGFENKNSKSYGPEVKKWTAELLAKSVKGGWNIGIDVAGSILSGALERYFGWKE